MNSKVRKIVAGTLMAAALATGTAYAESASGDFWYSNVHAYVHGYVDFQSKKIFSYTWCNVSLGGRDRDCVSAVYDLKAGSSRIAKKTLNYKNPSDSYDGKKKWGFASSATLKITYDDKECIIKAK